MIDLDRDGPVAIVTMNRPAQRNALSTGLTVALDEAFASLADDPEVRAIVLTGAPPGFCAGSDLKEMGRCDPQELAEHQRLPGAMTRRIGLMDTPVIAAVEGHAFGGGFVLAVCCDLVVTAEDTIWNLAEVPNGFLPPWGLTTLAARVGPVTARRLTWGFERFVGADALRLGIADYQVPSGQTLANAMDIAGELAALPAGPVAATKRFFQPMIQDGAEPGDTTARRVFVEQSQHEEARAVLDRYAGKDG